MRDLYIPFLHAILPSTLATNGVTKSNVTSERIAAVNAKDSIPEIGLLYATQREETRRYCQLPEAHGNTTRHFHRAFAFFLCTRSAIYLLRSALGTRQIQIGTRFDRDSKSMERGSVRSFLIMTERLAHGALRCIHGVT